MMNSQRPFERSYWAAPGQLLAGCYPGDLDPEAMSGKLEGLIRAGVTLVVNLMEATEVDHAGRPFIDYQLPLEQAAKKAGQQLGWVRFLPGYTQRVVQLCRKYGGFRPRLGTVDRTDGLVETLAMAANEEMISIQPTFISHLKVPNVVLVPLADAAAT